MIEVVLDNSAVKCGQLAFLSIIRSLKTMLNLVKKMLLIHYQLNYAYKRSFRAENK